MTGRYAAFQDPRAAFEDALTGNVIRRRVVAGLIDLALVGVLFALSFVLGTLFGIVTFGFGFAVLGLLPVIPVVYNWLFIALAAATPGQRVMGLVVRRNDDLRRPGGGEALVWALGFALTMTLTLGVLWLCVVLLSVRKRALHDMLSGLVVVRAQALAGVGL